MLAQYYKEEKKIVFFENRNGSRFWEIDSEDRKRYGLPPFSKWKKTSWGAELIFKFEVVSE